MDQGDSNSSKEHMDMKFGLVFPQIEFGTDPIAVREYAQVGEELGYSHILTYEHVLGANPERPGGWDGPYTYLDPFLEPISLFSFMAGSTKRIEFTTGILILPQRQTALFAKQAATLDVLSGGRLRIGIGLGWNMVEYTALNQDFHNRGKRVEEQVEVLRRLWTQPLVDFDGTWHKIPDAGLNPLPNQHPIPIWFGGHAEAVLQRIARLGDGWMPNYRTAEEALPSLERIRQYLTQTGRKIENIGIEARLPYGDGSPKIWEATILGWEAAGATHVSLNTMGSGLGK
jgi:probable F420-dependent oxidoreductase